MRTVVRLYHFFMAHLDGYGEPFALCDDCKRSYRVPDHCTMELFSYSTSRRCGKCGKRESDNEVD
jgi:hypothetical protein